MPLSIKDERTEQLARSAASRDAVSITAAICNALEHDAQRNDRESESAEQRFDVAVRRAQSMVRDGVIDWTKTLDELLGYDDYGIPEQR